MSSVPPERRSPTARELATESVDPPVRGAALDIQVITQGSMSLTARLVGELDVTTAARVGDILREQVERGRRFARLDMSGLTVCDGAGLAAIMRARALLATCGGTLTLTGVSQSFARLLRITHLDQALLVADEITRAPRER